MKTPPHIPGYWFETLLGEGGMSTVWRAWDEKNSRRVAIKILDVAHAANGEDVLNFKNEERFMASIEHPGIVRAFELNCHEGVWYLVMELVDGYTFAALQLRKQYISEGDCLLICESVASALDYAWNDYGIVHCDIKPENIMINSEGVVKLTDLGISHEFQFREDGAQPATDHVTGTPAYIAPEQVYGDVELDCRTDIYSLGATLYHLATGRTLFAGLDNEAMLRAHCDETAQARDPRLYRPQLSEGFVQMLEAMLVKNRDGRIASWTDVFSMAKDVESGASFKPRATTDVSSLLFDSSAVRLR